MYGYNYATADLSAFAPYYPIIICLVVGNNVIIINIINKTMTTTTIEVPAGAKILNITQESNRILLEFVPMFKNGDFLVKEYKDGDQYIFILDYIDDEGLIYYHCSHSYKYDSTYVGDTFGIGRIGDPRHKCLRYATDSERELMIAKLFKFDKQWNAEKLRIEDIPQRKFKPGDKVKLKDGMLDKRGEPPYFTEVMDVFIGKVLTVESCTSKGCLYLNEGNGWTFAEDWFEPYSDEPIVGELAIFWDFYKKNSSIKLYTGCANKRHRDHLEIYWLNAIRFISKEQFLEHIKD